MQEAESHPLKHWLDRMAAAHPQAPAIYIENEEIDYITLKQQVDALVTALTQAGIKSGNHLALVTSSARILALVAYAAPHMGITFLPLDPRFPEKWQNALLLQAGIEYVLCDNEVSERWGSDLNVITIGQLLLQQFALATPSAKAVTSIYTPLMLATSGSSDIPKVVLLTPENIVASVRSANKYLQLEHDDLWLDCMPLFHIAGLMILYRSIARGAAVVLHDRFNPEKVWHDLQKYPVTHLSLVPVMLLQLLEIAGDQAPPPSLRFVIIGGAALQPALAQRALKNRWPLYITYGMTETGSQIAGCRLDEAAPEGPPAVELYDGVEVRICNNESSADDSGRIALRGAQIMAGYAGVQDSSSRNPDQDGWLLTQDLGRLDSQGRLSILGRADGVIISAGENIHPLQVEAILQDCPGVDEIAIAGKDDRDWGQCLVAIYSGNAGIEEVEQWSRRNLKGGWRPRQFVRTERLPRLANGKLDRQSLLDMVR